MTATMIVLGMGSLAGADDEAVEPTWGVEDPDAETIPNTLVIGFDEEVPEDIDAWLDERDGTLERHNSVVHFVEAQFRDDVDLEDVEDEAHQRDDVRYVEPAYRVNLETVHDAAPPLLTEPLDPDPPDDPLYPDQWGFPAISAAEAWSRHEGSHDVKVAVLDTGADGDHEDLAANLCGPHTSTVGADPLDPIHYHGTHVAGTVAAINDNGIGVAGASEVCVMAVHVLYPGGSTTSIAEGVTFAAENGADVISMSLTMPESQAVRDAFEHAYTEADVLNVKSAGNSGCGSTQTAYAQGSITWPGPEPTIMPVAALAPPDGEQTAWFSSCGPSMEIAAPGQSVLSTIPGDRYGTASGTSMAAPHVSGIAAMVRDANPGLSALQTRCLLAHTADDVAAGDVGWDPYTGWGRLNASAALQIAEQLDPPSELSETNVPGGCGQPLNPVSMMIP